jgi:hypothetical protein
LPEPDDDETLCLERDPYSLGNGGDAEKGRTSLSQADRKRRANEGKERKEGQNRNHKTEHGEKERQLYKQIMWRSGNIFAHAAECSDAES